ncbi:MAG: uroporphyrinogen decarboxylase [Candidatus Atribacteria bacterium]|nr:uroporphyrinogen decarboxylase [Candidatus Atribacteria bacterium]
MTSKERILKTLSHQEPDHVPFDLGGTIVTGITKGIYSELLKYRGLTQEIRILDHVQQLVEVDGDVANWLEVDTKCGFPGISRKNPVIKEGAEYFYFEDEWGIRWGMPKGGGLYFDVISNPLAKAENTDDIEKYPWPVPQVEILKDLEEEISKQEEKMLMIESFGSGIFETALRLRGYEQFLIDLSLSPALAEAILEKILEVKLRYIDLLSQTLKGKIYILKEGDDLATQHSLLISKQMYCRFLKPKHQKLFEYAKKSLGPSFYIFFHSCGAVYDLIPDFIEAGIDILNPVQLSASKMSPEKLKRNFGKLITFWGGGVDTQGTLLQGNEDDVREEVERNVDIFAPGGGYVFAAVHNVQDDIPVKNLMVMWETWKSKL